MTKRLLIAAAALVVGGCGGHAREAERPKLPRPLAQQLVAQSDDVAARLAAGDACGALAAARELQASAAAAVAERRLPPALREPLLDATRNLRARIACVPAPEEDEEPGKHGHKDKGHHKGKEH
jgi:hypothetical protein